MTREKPVVVLGAGACGLCSTWALAEAGRKAILLEALDEPGGLCRTSGKNGYRFDLGGHRFISRNQELTNRILALMGDELLVSERKSVIRFRNKFYRYPLHAKELLLNMNPKQSVECFLSYLRSRAAGRLRPQPDNTLEQWLVSHYGRRLYSIFFEPYSTKLWGMSPSLISADWASQRISLLNLTDLVLRVLGLRKTKSRTYALKYYYPKRGIGEMADYVAGEITRLGAGIEYCARACQVNIEGGRVVSVDYIKDGKTARIECSHLVSTIPLPELIRLVNPEVPEVVRESADKLRFRGLRFMNMLLEGVEDISENTWWYLQDAGYIATRLQEPKRRSRYNAPEGTTSVMLEIPCTRGDDVWDMTDEDLFNRCVRDLHNLGLELRDKTVGYYTERIEHAYPVYSLDYMENKKRILEYLRAITNMVTCGRQGLFDYVFMDDAMLMGFEAAGIVLGQGSVESMYNRAQDKGLLEVKSRLAEEGSND